MLDDDFSKYEALRSEGKDCAEVYLAAVSDGLNWFSAMRMLRNVFALTLEEAKEVTITAENISASLEEHQGKLIPGLKNVLNDDEES